MTKGIKSSLGARFGYDHALSWMAIVVACTIIIETCYTKFVWVE
jgi:hypothetical protein